MKGVLPSRRTLVVRVFGEAICAAGPGRSSTAQWSPVRSRPPGTRAATPGRRSSRHRTRASPCHRPKVGHPCWVAIQALGAPFAGECLEAIGQVRRGSRGGRRGRNRLTRRRLGTDRQGRGEQDTAGQHADELDPVGEGGMLRGLVGVAHIDDREAGGTAGKLGGEFVTDALLQHRPRQR